ncbi:hypothetical protein RSOL_365300 [Rhizoctonia solani AG-3 Rhs1AP]|uniref:Uncharacterized protein n=1 Tax=Rhizoctonia solani AG-3 Rhs1AP TaxID=1086054 RepID=X8JD19_9AGAM|nr:hypothetical protein RSOL_365300 [Rhizoctonia solani AG-3 Rhs1AP]
MWGGMENSTRSTMLLTANDLKPRTLKGLLRRASSYQHGWLTSNHLSGPFITNDACASGALNLSLNMPLAGFTFKEDDEELSFDVQESLGLILQIPRHATALETYFLAIEPVEAERRHPMDTLGSLVWDLQSEERVLYRTERKLAIPCLPTQAGQARRENSGEVQPDACAFIYLPISEPPGIAQAALCTTADYRFAPHWVTEYKRDHDRLDSRRQVTEGLVSALYQRRAFGFPNHFVFGTAHYLRTTIEVVAATWVRSAEPAEPAARSQEATTMSSVLHEDQKNNPPGNSLQEGDATSSPSKTSDEVRGANTTLTIKDIKKYNKIVIYTIATYNMRKTGDMLQLYLLMRHTLALAQQYKDEIVKDGYSRVHHLMREAKEFYKWPPPPRPQSDRVAKRQRTGGSSEYSKSLASVPENQHNASIDPYGDSDYSSDSEELEPPHDAGPTRKIAGEVASYTLKNYAYEEDAEACGFGNSHAVRPSVSQTV